MTIEFSRAVDHDVTSPDDVDSDWISDLDPDSYPGIYILLSHACEVLRGTRQGGTTQHQPWLDHQIKHLLPCLMADIPELVQVMKDEGVDIPQVPTVAPETNRAVNSAIWNAHKAFMHGSP